MPQYFPRDFLLFLVFLCLTACGGGSSSSSSGNPGTNAQRTNQTPLTFELASISIGILDPVPTNPLSGGSGSGGTTYSSSDSSVATVDASTGALTLLAPGSTTITATKAADSNYLSASASYALVVEKAEQDPLIFAQDVMEIFLHEVVPANPLTGGEGGGDIIYNSSNGEVASVDSETGAVSLLSEGSAIITAIKAGDALFAASEASYEITVFEVLSDLKIHVGLSNTRINWETQHDTIETFRTSQYSCNVDNYPSCRNGRLRRFIQPPAKFYTDTFPKIGNLAYLYIQSPDYRSSQIRIDPAPVDIPLRWSHSLTAFNDRLWIIGGETESIPLGDNSFAPVFRNDIWSSKDGATWKLETENAEFSPRGDHIVLEFNDELYLFSGWVSLGGSRIRATREVWKSSDGVNWNQLTENDLPFSNNSGKVIVFDGKLWAVSSIYGDTPHNKVWSSEDGINWNLEVPFAPFPQRGVFTLYTDDEHIYMMGGYGNNMSYYDVWMSPDGVQWDQVVKDGGYEQFWEGKVVRLDDKFYAMGAWGDNTYEPTVYISDNARNWRMLPKADTIDVGPYFSVAVFKDIIWASNATGPGRYSRYIWTTTNGVNWRVPVDTSDIEWQEID